MAQNHGRSQQQRYHHGDLRRALIEGSIALITEHGVEALTLRGVARRVGVSHAAPKHHFATKEDLLIAVAEEGFRSLNEALERAASRHPEPFERLSAAGVAYVAFAADHPAHFRVMFGPHIARAKGITHEAGSVLLSASRLIAEEMGDASKGRTLSVTAWSLVHGLAMLWLDGSLVMTKQELRRNAQAATKLMTDAIRPSAGDVLPD